MNDKINIREVKSCRDGTNAGQNMLLTLKEVLQMNGLIFQITIISLNQHRIYIAKLVEIILAPEIENSADGGSRLGRWLGRLGSSPSTSGRSLPCGRRNRDIASWHANWQCSN